MIDMKGFQKVGETKTHTIFEHPEGHLIHVNNKALKPSERAEAKRIPLAEGTPAGSVGEQVAQAEEGKVPQIADPSASANAYDTAAAPQPQAIQTEGLQPVNTNVPSNEASNPYLAGVLTEQGMAQKGLQNQIQGLQGEASALGQQGQREAEVAGRGSDQERQALGKFEQQQTDLNTERESFIHDYAKGLINPNHYMENMGTGQKVRTAIGLLLGGMASQGDPSKNPVLSMLNSQNDRDIAAQVQNAGIRHNLVSANMAQMGNVRDAASMAKIMRRDQIAYDLQRQAALMKSPQAQALAQQHAGQLMAQSAQEMGALATQRAALSGNAGQNLPATLDPAFDRRVDIGNAVFHAPDKEVANKVRPQLQALDELESAVNRVDQFNKKVGPTTGLPTKAGGQAQGLNKEIEAAIAKVEASGGSIGRLMDKFKEMSPVAGSVLPSRGAGRSQSIHDFIAAQKAAIVKENLSTGPIIPERSRGRK